MAFLPQIKAVQTQSSISTGGSATMTLDARLEGAPRSPSCVPQHGTLIFDFCAAGARIEAWQHAWEQPYVEDHAAGSCTTTHVH
jgi:hypothetical protein